jgi:hypothetical protein
VPKESKIHHTETSAVLKPSQFAVMTDRTFTWATAAILLGGLMLRVFGITQQEVWMDEAFSALIAQLDREQLIAALRPESNPPLYYFLLKGLCSISGYSPIALRLPSVVFSIATIAVITLYGARVVSRAFGLAAGGFLMLSPHSIYYAQEARGYSFLILLFIVALLAIYDAVINDSKPAVWMVAAAVLAAGYTHYLAALTLLPVGIWLAYQFACYPDRRRIIYWLVGVLAMDALVCAAWMMPSLVHRDANPQLWIAEQWSHLDKLWVIPKSLLVLTLGSAQGFTPLFMKQATLLKQPLWIPIVALLASAILFSLSLASRTGKAKLDASSSTSWWLFAAVLLPLFSLYSMSFLKPLYVLGRYDVVGFPFLVLLFGWMGFRASELQGARRLFAYGAAIALSGSLVYKDALMLTADRVYQDYDAQKSAALVDQLMGDRDLVIFTGMRGTGVLYYLNQLGYQWNSAECIHSERRINARCRILPYSDSGVPFVMGTPVTAPVTVDTAISDITPEIEAATRRGAKILIVVTRLRSSAGDAIDRRLGEVLQRSGYRSAPSNPELRAYRIFVQQPPGAIPLHNQ